MHIDWLSDESHLLLNPRMPDEERRRLESYLTPLRGHLWLATSGTTGALKLTALSKEAMLASAAAVNRHLQSDSNDVWLCVLPTFHVGGLGIYARAFLSGARIVTEGWDGVTLASLVPTQVRDFVHARTPVPPSLRAVVIGGGALPAALYEQARALGWPLLPSYGMTECCSQVATATVDSPELRLLDHMEARTEDDGRLALRSAALFTGYGTGEGFIDPKVDRWFVTEDVAAIDGHTLRVQGRRGDFVKIAGESVDLSRLDRILAGLGADAAAIAIPDERLGHVIAVAIASGGDAVIEAFNARVFPYERARRVIRVTEIARTPLGKIMRNRIAW
ncbi:MAG TPA: AMP-binding protein [Thermoanaerobaculia bacterium]|nr:AMP-binding protein [Thermoanaerobaculia bacterium]